MGLVENQFDFSQSSDKWKQELERLDSFPSESMFIANLRKRMFVQKALHELAREVNKALEVSFISIFVNFLSFFLISYIN